MPKDTSAEIEAIYIKKLKEKTASERAMMGFSMFETARALVKTTLNPKLRGGEEKVAIFEKFYGNDFDQQKKNKISAYFKKHS